jgi:hypothetical protein
MKARTAGGFGARRTNSAHSTRTREPGFIELPQQIRSLIERLLHGLLIMRC